MSALVCEKINCPFWSRDTKKSYGCQRWEVANLCHLRANHPNLNGSNQYALYLPDDKASDSFLVELKEENDLFFSVDKYYLDKVGGWR